MVMGLCAVIFAEFLLFHETHGHIFLPMTWSMEKRVGAGAGASAPDSRELGYIDLNHSRRFELPTSEIYSTYYSLVRRRVNPLVTNARMGNLHIWSERADLTTYVDGVYLMATPYMCSNYCEITHKKCQSYGSMLLISSGTRQSSCTVTIPGP